MAHIQCEVPTILVVMPNTVKRQGTLIYKQITFANCLDQARRSAGPDLGSKSFDILIVVLKYFLKSIFFSLKKRPTDDNISMKSYLACKELCGRLVKSTCCVVLIRKKSSKTFVLQQQQNIGRRFGQ